MLFNLWARLSYFLKDFSLYLIIMAFAFPLSIIAAVKIYHSQRKLVTKKLYLSAIFTLFIFIISFSAIEAYFRYVYDQSDGLGFLKVNNKWHARHVVYNNYFFRDRNFEVDKKEGITRIGVLGDSITAGGGIEKTQDRFSNILESKLTAAGFQAEVYNLGKFGYDTQEEIEAYQKVKHLNFDLLVWQYFLNDVQPKGQTTATPILLAGGQKSRLLNSISEKSYFLDFLYWRFSNKYQTTFEELKNADLNQYGNRELLQQHQKIMADFLKSLKEEDKKVVVVIFPFVHLLGPNYPAGNVHKLVSGFFAENGVEVIDLLDILENKQAKSLIASRFDAHPNELVHNLAADELFKLIKTIIPR